MSRSKINTALRTSKIGDCTGTALHLLDVAAIPADVQATMTGKQLGAVLDALWRVAQTSKAIAAQDSLAEGCIWDAKHQTMHEIACV